MSFQVGLTSDQVATLRYASFPLCNVSVTKDYAEKQLGLVLQSFPQRLMVTFTKDNYHELLCHTIKRNITRCYNYNIQLT